MSIELLTDRYAKQIAGTISCYDRMLLIGTLPTYPIPDQSKRLHYYFCEPLKGAFSGAA